jgi:hypothetical protein
MKYFYAGRNKPTGLFDSRKSFKNIFRRMMSRLLAIVRHIIERTNNNKRNINDKTV